jgi:FKBP-type peptidyl-prolyl cis-trans isomerase FkpA
VRMRGFKTIAVALPLAWIVSVTGCGGDGNPVAPSASVPFTITDLVVGTGAEALQDLVMTVAFTGWLFDENGPDNKGSVFDQSSGFRFRLGAANLIDGWNQGIEGMRVLGTRRIVVPPELGFGSAGSGGAIPPNATLIFEIELLEIE